MEPRGGQSRGQARADQEAGARRRACGAACDPHWNARDQEYVEGLTKCLHYTALHQQPWHPFPGDYSYHPNPLAYIWYGLEREADAAGYQVFTRAAPSPDFAAVLGSNRPPEAMISGPLLSEAAGGLLRQTGARSLLVTGIDGALNAPLGATELTPTRLRFRPRPWAPARGALRRRAGRRNIRSASPVRRTRTGSCASCSLWRTAR